MFGSGARWTGWLTAITGASWRCLPDQGLPDQGLPDQGDAPPHSPLGIAGQAGCQSRDGRSHLPAQFLRIDGRHELIEPKRDDAMHAGKQSMCHVGLFGRGKLGT